MNNRERIMRLRQEKKLDRNEMIQLLETANREDRAHGKYKKKCCRQHMKSHLFPFLISHVVHPLFLTFYTKSAIV